MNLAETVEVVFEMDVTRKIKKKDENVKEIINTDRRVKVYKKST